MAKFKVGFNPTTYEAHVLTEAEDLPEGTTNIGTFDHPDLVYPDSYVLFHKVKELLYFRSQKNPTQEGFWPDNITNMERVIIRTKETTPTAPPVILESLSAVPTSLELAVDEEVTLFIHFTPKDTTDKNISLDNTSAEFVSSEFIGNIADEDGEITSRWKITGISAGTGELTANYVSDINKFVTIPITVE